MTKITIFVPALLAGIAIAAGGNRLPKRSSTGSATSAKQRSGRSRDSFAESSGVESSSSSRPLEASEDSLPETLIDQKLLDYFDRDESVTKDEFQSSPRAKPVYFIEDSIWNNFDLTVSKNNTHTTHPNDGKARTQNEGVISSIMRRFLFFCFDDNVDDMKQNPNNYQNYHKEDLREHDEELVTDDDGAFEAESPSVLMPSNTEPTLSPSAADSSYWNDLDAYDQNDIKDSDILLDRPINSIVLRVALGVVNFKTMSRNDTLDITGMALRTMTIVLNENSSIPFLVDDKLDKSSRKRERNRELKASFASSSSSASSSDSNPQRELQWVIGIDDRIPVENPPVEAFTAGNHLAEIFLESVKIETVANGWWEVSAIYSVWKNRRRRPHSGVNDDPEVQELPETLGKTHPVKSRAILKKVEGICDKAIEKAMEEDVFWETLQVVPYGSQDLVVERNELYYVNDKGIFDVQPVGCEYDVSKWLCPFQQPRDGEKSVCPKPNVGPPINCSERIYGAPDKDDIPLPDLPGDFEGTYPNTIADSLSEIEWMTREWAGLGMMIFTVVWASVLSVGGHFIKKRRMKQRAWGAPLTHEGVDDFLEVGWRVYEQPQQEQLPKDDQALGVAPGDPHGVQQQQPQQQSQEPQSPQMFLQIYDKGRDGYNDENSLLRGGVEQQMFAPATPTSQPSPNQHENNANVRTADPHHIP